MKLNAYPKLDQRRHKVFKHVYDHRERWWEIFDDLPTWHEKYSVLRALGCYGDAAGWRLAEGNDTAEGILDHSHSAWLGSAEVACDQAVSSARVYPSGRDRSAYVGDLGVVVHCAPGAHLVTCFRPRQCLGSALDEMEVTERADAYVRRRTNFSLRAGVRRSVNRASLDVGADSGRRGLEQ